MGRIAGRGRREEFTFLVLSIPVQFQCRRGAARRVVVRVKVEFLGAVAGKGITNAAIAPTKPPKMANSTFWLVYESTTPAMLIA
jgi:hypothetical protein